MFFFIKKRLKRAIYKRDMIVRKRRYL